jgi:hypothetical protein
MGQPTKDSPQALFGSRVLIGFDVGYPGNPMLRPQAGINKLRPRAEVYGPRPVSTHPTVFLVCEFWFFCAVFTIFLCLGLVWMQRFPADRLTRGSPSWPFGCPRAELTRAFASASLGEQSTTGDSYSAPVVLIWNKFDYFNLEHL